MKASLQFLLGLVLLSNATLASSAIPQPNPYTELRDSFIINPINLGVGFDFSHHSIDFAEGFGKDFAKFKPSDYGFFVPIFNGACIYWLCNSALPTYQKTWRNFGGWFFKF